MREARRFAAQHRKYFGTLADRWSNSAAAVWELYR